MSEPGEFSADGIRAALMLTRRAAETQFSLAYDLVTACRRYTPRCTRARVLSDWTTELSVEQARSVCDTLLPRVPALTTGQLIEQIKKTALATDPA